MQEKLNICIDSSLLHEDSLEIHDALEQLQDIFSLLGSDNDVSWKITHASKNSPLSLGVESFSTKHTPEVTSSYAKISKENFEKNITSLVEGKIPFEWSRGSKYQAATNILKRSQNGVGECVFDFCDELPPIRIIPIVAARAYNKIVSRRFDLKRDELGSIDGHIVDIGEHYGNPAIQLFDRLRRVNVWCVVPNEHIDVIAESNDWRDVWDKQRVKVRGRISYAEDGSISRVTLSEFVKVHEQPVSVGKIRDKNFTCGMPPDEYLDSMEES